MDAVRGVFVDKSMPRRLPKLQLFHYMTDGRDFRHGNGPPPGAMVGFLSNLPDLRVLALPNLENFGDAELAAVVAHCPRLHTLELRGTGVTEVGWRSLLDETALKQLRAADYENEAYEFSAAATVPYQWFADERRGMPNAPAWEYVDAELNRIEQLHLTEECKMDHYIGTEEECDANIIKYFAYLRAVLWRGLFAKIGPRRKYQWEHELIADGTLLEASYPNVEISRDGKRRSVPIS